LRNWGTSSDALAGFAAGCPYPQIAGYDPAAVSEAQSPHAGWARARQEQPVFYTAQHDLWWVSRYEDVKAVLSDPVTFRSKAALKTVPPPPEVADEFALGLPWEHTLVVSDPPEHSRLRRLVQVAFTAKVVARWEPTIRGITDSLIDKFAERGEVDLVPEFAEPIPLILVTRILNSPESDAPQLREWTNDFFRLLGSGRTLSDEDVLAHYKNITQFQRYCMNLVDARRASPGDDIVSVLINARTPEGDPQLTTLELVSLIMSLFAAGNETTASLIALTVYCLLRHPEQWREVQQDPTLIPAAVEETLRFLGPVKGIQRTATVDTSINGVEIPAGAQLYILIGSANRDADAWPEADDFDIHREDLVKHMMFGIRTHYCIGAHIARLEAKVALEHLIQRVPGIRLKDGADIAYRPVVRVLSPSTLPLVWNV
jgi:cytochrome P450